MADTYVSKLDHQLLFGAKPFSVLAINYYCSGPKE